MNGSDPSATRSFADRLNHLFDTVVPAGRGPYSTAEVAQAITDQGEPVSGSYLWMLRKGQRDNPTLRHLNALAKFFGVPPAYFFDQQVTEQVDTDLELLVSLRDAGVRNVALRASGLSPRASA